MTFHDLNTKFAKCRNKKGETNKLRRLKVIKYPFLSTVIGSIHKPKPYLRFSAAGFMTPQILNNAKSDILEAMHLKQLFTNLPPKTQNQPWSLAYSTSASGYSLKNLYRSVAGGPDDSKLLRQMSMSPANSDVDAESSPCLIVIQSMEGNQIFGG